MGRNSQKNTFSHECLYHKINKSLKSGKGIGVSFEDIYQISIYAYYAL